MKALTEVTPTLIQGAEIVTTQVLEHAMRLIDDELLVERLAACQGGSEGAAASVGRLLSLRPHPIKVGSPLYSLLTLTPVDPLWRSALPEVETSLWKELEFLQALHGEIAETENPLEALRLLRARSL